MLQKLRRAMVAPEREPLRGEVEVDEFYLGGLDETHVGRRLGARKALCGVAVEVRGRGSGRVRLAVLEDLSGRSLGSFVNATTEAGAIVHTDSWGGYRPLGRAGFDHRPIRRVAVLGQEPYLPRAHRAISNLKAWLHGTHRWTSRQHLQVYLDEFTFRHNRRHTPMAAFQTLLGLGARHEPSSYRQITRRAA
jgi:transposase-like protein